MGLTYEQWTEIVDSVPSFTKEEVDKMSRTEYMMKRYWHIKDPNTGHRFIIYGLSPYAVDYVVKYGAFMETLVNDPKTFAKIINLD